MDIANRPDLQEVARKVFGGEYLGSGRIQDIAGDPAFLDTCLAAEVRAWWDDDFGSCPIPDDYEGGVVVFSHRPTPRMVNGRLVYDAQDLYAIFLDDQWELVYGSGC